MLFTSFLLLISTLGLMIIFTPRLLKSLRDETDQQTRPVTGVFWAVAFLTFFYNCFLQLDILLLVETCPAVHTACNIKVAVMLFSVIVGVGWMIWAYCRAMALPPHPEADNCRCLHKTCCQYFLYSFAFFNVSFSICNLTATILPTFLLATVYPTEVLSTAALTCLVIFSIFAVLFAYKKTVNTSECQRAINSLCNVILLSLFLMSVVLIEFYI